MKKILFLIFLTITNLSATRILFDLTKEEDAGNADWMIDNDYPYPQPPNPATGDDWIGGISDWGFDLHSMGYEVVTLPPWGRITYGDPANELDLSNFDVFIVCEPQIPFTTDEINAILNFVRNGGGLFMVADHNASDRNNNGWDSPHIWNLFENYFGIHFNVTGDPSNYISDRTFNVSDSLSDPIVNGPLGTVNGMSFYGSTVMTLRMSINPTLRGHVWKSGVSQGSTYVFLATGLYGRGKIVGLTDSSPADDGTGNPGNNLFDGWNESGVQNNIAILNATLWLASTSPYIITVTFLPVNPSPDDSVYVTANFNFERTEDSLFYRMGGTSWVGTSPVNSDSLGSTYLIPPSQSETYVNFYVRAVTTNNDTIISDTFTYITRFPGDTLDMTNWKLIQENSYREYIFGNLELPLNSILIISRNSSKQDFERFWGISLSPDVIFINSQGSIPVINGDETFTLINADGDTVDGPTISMIHYLSYQRRDFNGDPGNINSWDTLDWHLATPGYVEYTGSGTFIGISEMTDPDSTNAYVYEFVEIFYGNRSVSISEKNQLSPSIKLESSMIRKILNLTHPAKNIRIFNINGQEVLSFPGYRRVFNVSDLPEGMYLLMLNDKKIIKFIKY